MLKVKYPETHGLDGKWHFLEIVKAKRYNGRTIIKCIDNGKQTVIEVSKSNKVWFMVPFDSKDLLNHLIIIENDQLGKDITDIIKKELDNKTIINKEEFFVPKEKLTMYKDKKTKTYYIEIPDWYRIQGITPPESMNVINGREVMEGESLSTIFHQVTVPEEYDYLVNHYYVKIEYLIINSDKKHR